MVNNIGVISLPVRQCFCQQNSKWGVLSASFGVQSTTKFSLGWLCARFVVKSSSWGCFVYTMYSKVILEQDNIGTYITKKCVFLRTCYKEMHSKNFINVFLLAASIINYKHKHLFRRVHARTGLAGTRRMQFFFWWERFLFSFQGK